MKATNTSIGPRGLNTLDGVVMLAPGEMRDDLRMSRAEYESAKSTGSFELSGKPEPEIEGDGPGFDEIEKVRQQERSDAADRASEVARQHEEALDAEREKTAAAIQRAEAAEAKLAALPGANGDNTQPPALAATHRGGGSYSVMRGDAELKGGLTKAQAEAFNAKDDDAKAAEVASYPNG